MKFMLGPAFFFFVFFFFFSESPPAHQCGRKTSQKEEDARGTLFFETAQPSSRNLKFPKWFLISSPARKERRGGKIGKKGGGGKGGAKFPICARKSPTRLFSPHFCKISAGPCLGDEQREGGKGPQNQGGKGVWAQNFTGFLSRPPHSWGNKIKTGQLYKSDRRKMGMRETVCQGGENWCFVLATPPFPIPL